MTLSIIDLELTNACNQRCGFCLRPAMGRPVCTMDTELFKRLVREISDLDLPSWGKVVFAGYGEPTLHPRFVELVDYAAGFQLPIRIHTNGTRWTPQIGRALVQPGIAAVHVSINVHGPEQLERAIGQAVSWEELVRNVSNLIALRTLAGRESPQLILQLIDSSGLSTEVLDYETPMLNSSQEALTAIHFWQDVAENVSLQTGIPAMRHSVSLADFEKPGPRSLRKNAWRGFCVELFEGVELRLCPHLP
ncbi:MAG: radical SAM protein, partial [Planctomycetaceae bacterium]|nr:radical SAM protein [Planctomycetaceae bacterium]